MDDGAHASWVVRDHLAGLALHLPLAAEDAIKGAACQLIVQLDSYSFARHIFCMAAAAFLVGQGVEGWGGAATTTAAKLGGRRSPWKLEESGLTA